MYLDKNDSSEIYLTRGDDEQLKKEILNIERELITDQDIDLDEELEEDSDTWEITSITHGPTTTTIEHRSDRNHLGVSTIIWIDGIT